ncbi:ribonuclease III [Lignipirellula cremea]|uniref:Ribonuclease 3 n=1 Tax=Lignipirellula cremea TaxID=2528010 RepID=A0A518DUQ0_9BACT|nr:ribonuclease III [Lignipirellula cremea]QDU95563.1 Ribonuclease 3 [Lignipirellula cremea]
MVSSSEIQSDELEEKLAACEQRIGYVFTDKSLLNSALLHASGADHRVQSNERLEFLGDAIFGAVVCEMLFRKFPNYLEGDLTKIKSVVVSRQTCARISDALGLEDFLIVGKGMASTPKVPRSLLADVFESLVAAMYLDGGDEPARAFIVKHIVDEIDRAASDGVMSNYKSQLQQYVQREFGSTPAYQLVNEKGPDHSKCFQIAAQVADDRYHPAWGRNKKEAEQKAACNALAQLRGEPPVFHGVPDYLKAFNGDGEDALSNGKTRADSSTASQEGSGNE